MFMAGMKENNEHRILVTYYKDKGHIKENFFLSAL